MHAKMDSKTVLGIWMVVLLLCIKCCNTDAKQDLETHSIFYGLALTAANRNNPGNICEKQLATLEKGVRDRDRWAIKMMDASGVPNTGLYWGNIFWLGSKKQCAASVSTKQIAVSAQVGPVTMETPDAIPPFPVDYYAAYFNHNSTMQVFMHWRNEVMITLGLCIPSSCQESDVQNLLQEYFDSSVLYHQSIYNMSFQLEGVKKVSDDYSWLNSTKFTFSFALIVSFIVICLLGTAYDLLVYQPLSELRISAHSENNNSKRKTIENDTDCKQNTNEKVKIELSVWEKVLCSFSLSANAKKICSSDGDDSLRFIHGLRFFTSVYVILNHGMMFMADHFDNKISAVYISDTVINQVFANSQYSVETFFTISGFLVAYSFLKDLNKKHNVKSEESFFKNLMTLLKGVSRRFVRLTPAYMVALCIANINATWRYRDTAFWSEEKSDVHCSKYWWRNILYINNLYPRSEMCMSWSWYLSNDMQFFIVCYALLILSKSHLRLAAGILGGIFAGSCLYTAYIVYSTNFIPYLDMTFVTLDLLYDPPWVRIGPYIVGVAAGYIYYLVNGKYNLSKHNHRVWLLCVVGISLNLVTLLGVPDKNISLPASVLYVTFGKNIWAIGVALIIIACVTNNGGLLQRFLSLKCWVPFSKICYCAYLINPILIYSITTLNEKSWQVERATAILFGASYITLSFICAFIFSLFVESPIIELVRALTSPESSKSIVKDVKTSSEEKLFKKM